MQRELVKLKWWNREEKKNSVKAKLGNSAPVQNGGRIDRRGPPHRSLDGAILLLLLWKKKEKKLNRLVTRSTKLDSFFCVCFIEFLRVFFPWLWLARTANRKKRKKIENIFRFFFTFPKIAATTITKKSTDVEGGKKKKRQRTRWRQKKRESINQ